MSWSNRVIWQEGMFLRTQHFQQQDRWAEALVRSRTTALRPFGWGLSELQVSRDLLAQGRFAVAQASGCFQDGTPFSIPGEADHPTPLDLPDNTRNVLVYLAMPIQQAGAPEVADAATEARYATRAFDAYDTHSAAPEPAPLQVGRLRMRYLLETDDRAGYLCIGLARIAEVSADRRVSLEAGWIPPALACVASPVLAGMLNEVVGMIGTRGNALAARLSAPGAAGVSSYADFLLLQTINGWQGLFAHWADGAAVHPEQLYSAFVQLAGQLATFTDATGRRPGSYPGYRHEDLQRSFAPVAADIGRCLSTDWENSAIPIPLIDQKYGVRVGRITDRKILRSASFVLTAQADMRAQDFRRLFPSQVKIGAFEHLRELVTVAMPGIEIRPLPVAPRSLPFHNGSHYFELDRASPHWPQMQASAAFGIHVSGDFPGLQLELWAIRG